MKRKKSSMGVIRMVNRDNKDNLTAASIGRRDFIRKSAAACCLANFPFAVSGSPKGKSPNTRTLQVKPVELAAYCGLYCGACDIYQKRIGQSGEELRKVLDAYRFDEITTQVPGLENYEAFHKVLNTLVIIFGQCSGCPKGGGPPQCDIRNCCSEKGYKTCAECSSGPCEKLKPLLDSYPQLEEDLQEIKKSGLEKWSREQQGKVDKGLRYSDILSGKS
jgi:hypothetical protein